MKTRQIKVIKPDGVVRLAPKFKPFDRKLFAEPIITTIGRAAHFLYEVNKKNFVILGMMAPNVIVWKNRKLGRNYCAEISAKTLDLL